MFSRINSAKTGLISVNVSEDFVLESNELFVEQFRSTREVDVFEVADEGISQ